MFLVLGTTSYNHFDPLPKVSAGYRRGFTCVLCYCLLDYFWWTLNA